MKAPAGGPISLFSHKVHSFFGKPCAVRNATGRSGISEGSAVVSGQTLKTYKAHKTHSFLRSRPLAWDGSYTDLPFPERPQTPPAGQTERSGFPARGQHAGANVGHPVRFDVTERVAYQDTSFHPGGVGKACGYRATRRLRGFCWR
jgi:hypothetical protein